MKKTVLILSLCIFSIQKSFTSTNSLKIINQSSDEISITLETMTQTVSQSALPNENHRVNTMNNSVLTSTSLTYTISPITKIIITRISTNLPQIIYYNKEVTVDQKQQPTGIYSINLGKPGTIIVLQDSVTINDQSYNLTDLKSFMIKCNQLNSQITTTNLDLVEKQIGDITTSIKLIQDSDKNTEIGSQIIAIQAQVDLIKNNSKTMAVLINDMKTVQDLTLNLSDQNREQTKTTMESLLIGLNTMMQSHLQGAVYTQAQAVQNGIQKLKIALQQHGVSFEATNHEFLIPYSQDLQFNYQQISSTL